MRCGTLFIATAITIYSTITIASTHAATHTTTHSTPLQHHSIIHNNNDYQSTPATTTFSCGTKLQTAKQCTTLCIDGDDSSCPPGQYCYAGIPCNHETVVRMEEQIIKRMMEEREGQTKRFVCAVSFEEAEKSCRRRTNNDDEIYYCESGQSSECPSGMQCFASVAYCSDNDDDKSVGSTSLSSPQLLQQQQPQPILSFSSSPTTNATPTPNHQDNDSSYNNNDNVYSIHTIVDKIGSKLWTSLGLVYS